MMKNMTECARSAVMRDGEISKHVETFYKESHRDARYPQIYSKYKLPLRRGTDDYLVLRSDQYRKSRPRGLFPHVFISFCFGYKHQ